MSNLHRLVYTSYRKAECDDQEIEKILAASRRNNPSLQITGVLMHSKNRFIQYIEGDRQVLLDLYERIQEDPRHTSVNQRNFEPIESRAFPSWQMAYKNLTRDGLEFNTAATELNVERFEELITGEVDFTDEGLRVLHLFFNMA